MEPSRPAAPMEVAEAVGRLALNDCSCGQTNVQPDSDASLIWVRDLRVISFNCTSNKLRCLGAIHL